MAVLGINYEGGGRDYDDNGNVIKTHPITYQSVYLKTHEDKFVFDSGDFIKDWFLAMKKFHTELDTEKADPFLSHSSSVNHFIMDGAPYSSAYLHMLGEEPVLKYVDKTQEHWVFSQADIYEGGDEFFVEDGTTPTWQELKSRCHHV